MKLPVCVSLCMALYRSVLSNTICPYLIFTLLTLKGEERRGFCLPINTTLLLTLNGNATQSSLIHTQDHTCRCGSSLHGWIKTQVDAYVCKWCKCCTCSWIFMMICSIHLSQSLTIISSVLHKHTFWPVVDFWGLIVGWLVVKSLNMTDVRVFANVCSSSSVQQ